MEVILIKRQPLHQLRGCGEMGSYPQRMRPERPKDQGDQKGRGDGPCWQAGIEEWSLKIGV